MDMLWKALYDYEDETEKQFQESDELDIEDWFGHRIFVQNMNDIDRQTILEMPSVEAEPVRHGHWIDETFKPTSLVFHPYVCDQCGCHSESNFTYCPDCGARMDKETL